MFPLSQGGIEVCVASAWISNVIVSSVTGIFSFDEWLLRAVFARSPQHAGLTCQPFRSEPQQTLLQRRRLCLDVFVSFRG